ncbi:MAG TPA: iron-containing alcohol dehydrogenase family protein [Candidatus Hydrogenedentes bacterium]|nr:iron-containing alcohol dehydrogenase family protein [Candidatus Hydrogenedentota bacterium]
MMPSWLYRQPTEIRFGCGIRQELGGVAASLGKRTVLVTDRTLVKQDTTLEVIHHLGGNTPVFSDIEPNPTVHSVDLLAGVIRQEGSDVVVALGGGSSLDCAKAAASIALQGTPARAYHSEGKTLDARHLPVITIPTTAGTGSEVTPIAVLDDPEKSIKAPLVHDNFFPKVALVDPELTVTMPKFVTACTGLDALAHAVEGYWSRNHQPICDLMAREAAGLVFRHLPSALADGGDLGAREGMSLAALLGGLAFQLPKNAAVHACSFPLSNRYHLAHGLACAMTLDWFIRFNTPVLGGRGLALARAAGFNDLDAMADAVATLKRQALLPLRLSEAGAKIEEVDSLVEASFHPLMKNNPREVTASDLRSLYLEIM